MRELERRVVLVTGAAQGLGAAMCSELADAGATVAMVDRSERVHDRVRELVEARVTGAGSARRRSHRARSAHATARKRNRRADRRAAYGDVMAVVGSPRPAVFLDVDRGSETSWQRGD